MKPIALLAFFFLLFAFTTTAKFVLDSDGDPLVSGGKYYLQPLDSVGGGDIIEAAIWRGTSTKYCDLGVIQYGGGARRETTIEAKFVFYVQTDYPVGISSPYLPPNVCSNTSKWLVIESEPLGQAVMVGDAKEFLEPVVSGWFQIKANDSKYYNLVFCTRSDNCGDIGTRIDNLGYRRLVTTDEKPLLFKFQKIRSGILSEQEEARKLNVV